MKLWCRRPIATSISSIALPQKHTVLLRAEKGGGCRSNRSIERRQIDKNPCCYRWLRPSSRVANNARERGDAPVAIPLLEPFSPTRLCAADTAYDSDTLRSFLITRGTEPVIPNNPTQTVRPGRLPKTEYNRADILPSQGLEACRDAIRQAHDKLRSNVLHRSYRHMVDQLSLEPSTTLAELNFSL